jgi:hypothetical protein
MLTIDATSNHWKTNKCGLIACMATFSIDFFSWKFNKYLEYIYIQKDAKLYYYEKVKLKNSHKYVIDFGFEDLKELIKEQNQTLP